MNDSEITNPLAKRLHEKKDAEDARQERLSWRRTSSRKEKPQLPTNSGK